MTLQQAHITDLARSGLTEAHSMAVEMRSVPAEEVSRLLGFPVHSPGFVIPYPATDAFRIRLDSPHVFQDGREAKYLCPRGAAVSAYMPPDGLNALLKELSDDGERPLVIAEGEKKALVLRLLGYSVVGIPGVWAWVLKGNESGVIPDLEKLLPLITRRPVVLAFDSDARTNMHIARAAARLTEILRNAKALVTWAFPANSDTGEKCGVDDLYVIEGEQAVRQLVAGGCDPEDPACYVFKERVRRISEEEAQDLPGSELELQLREVLAQVPTRLRSSMAAWARKEMRLPVQYQKALLLGLEAAGAGDEDPDSSTPPLLTDEDRAIGEAFLRQEGFLEKTLQDLRTIGVVREDDLKESLYCIATSRLLHRPLSAEVVSASATGKSFVSERDLELIPPEGKLLGTSFSDQALYYLQEDALQHKVVFHSEKARGKENESDGMGVAFREMISSGVLRKVVTLKNPTTGQFETEVIERQGPISFIETTTDMKRFCEDATRMLRLYADESEEQTQAVQSQQRTDATGAGLSRRQSAADVIRRHHAAQRILAEEARDLDIVIPFAERIQFPSTTVSMRRLQPAFLSLIMTVALIHIRHRRSEVDTDGRRRLEASEDDFQKARDLFRLILSRSLDSLDDKLCHYLERVRERSGTEEFKRQNVEVWLMCSRSTASLICQTGVHHGAFEKVGEEGRAYVYRATTVWSPDDPGPDDRIFLELPEDARTIDLTTSDKESKPSGGRSSDDQDDTDSPSDRPKRPAIVQRTVIPSQTNDLRISSEQVLEGEVEGVSDLASLDPLITEYEAIEFEHLIDRWSGMGDGPHEALELACLGINRIRAKRAATNRNGNGKGSGSSTLPGSGDRPGSFLQPKADGEASMPEADDAGSA
ncbi:MAG: DUF3854 domain-containing protein [Planctomycetota bacterium]|nr:DUF3854 domain-containing protein [Planctomycetota bacterium]